MHVNEESNICHSVELGKLELFKHFFLKTHETKALFKIHINNYPQIRYFHRNETILQCYLKGRENFVSRLPRMYIIISTNVHVNSFPHCLWFCWHPCFWIIALLRSHFEWLWFSSKYLNFFDGKIGCEQLVWLKFCHLRWLESLSANYVLP